MATYDLLGNIALVKFPRKTSLKEKKKFALHFLKSNKSVRTILEKSSKISGRLRTPKTKFIAGEKTREALYKENGCAFRLNVDSCYFSPRLSTERKEIAHLVQPNENVLVMFSGVSPFPIVISKYSKAKKIIAVELGKACVKYAKENIKRNKLHNIELIQGDVRKVIPKMKKGVKFDRIVMARPNLKDSFLDIAFPRIKKGGIIHYYGFYEEEKKGKLAELINIEARKAKKKIKFLKLKRAGDIGVRKYRFRADVQVLN